MGEQQQSSIPWCGIILLGIAAFIGYEIWRNQIQPPVPGLPPAPVVPELPSLIADLRSAKSNCEGLGRQLKEMKHGGRLAASDLDRGGQLYTAAKAKYDGCIEFLRIALIRRFAKDDPERIKDRMNAANQKLMDFTAWADKKINPNVLGAAGPLGEALEHLKNWMESVNKENDEAIEKLRADLSECRLIEWVDLR